MVSYKELARVCRTSPRAIGRIMAANPDPFGFPCYKVVASSGELGGYSGPGGLEGKLRLLKKDGVGFSPNDYVLPRYFYTFKSSF